MGYGQFVYRRSSGIYVARLSVPSRVQDRLGRRKIHVSTGQRSRHDALTTAAAVAECWRSVFSDFSRLDALKIVAGSPLLIGTGIISLVDAAGALGMEPQALALELANRGSALMVNASGWDAVDVPDLSRVYREDGYSLWYSVQEEGEPCRVFGLVTLLGSQSMVLDFLSASQVYAWHVLVHNRLTSGDVFVAPSTAWLTLADLLVGKPDVEALRAAAASAITAAKVLAASPILAAGSGGAAVPDAAVPGSARVGAGLDVGMGALPGSLVAAEGVGLNPTYPGGPVPPSLVMPISGTGLPTASVVVSSGTVGVGSRHSAMRVSELIDAFIRAMT